MALIFPGNPDEPFYVTTETNEDPYDDIPEQELMVEPNKWYLISPPLCPYNFTTGYLTGINEAIGDDLDPDKYEQTWRIAKWWYDSNDCSFKYFYYNNPDEDDPVALRDDLYYGEITTENEPFMFFPGKGFWLYHIKDEAKPIKIQGDNYNPQETIYWSDPYMLRSGESEGELGAYMAGNPYWFDIKWKDCQVVVDSNLLWNMYESGYYVVPKVAAFSPDKIQKWHIRLKLESLDGSAVDTYNRAGVVMTEGADYKYFWAFDMTPIGSYVRLVLNDPSDPGRKPLAYDYRAPGLDEYTWEVNLTTTFSRIDARLSFADFDLVPDTFLITLRDTDTGETYTINGNDSFKVSLESGKKKIFILTATRAKDQPLDSDETQPVPFGIRNVYPNPFNPAATITFGLEHEGNVKVRIYNIAGQLVETIVNTNMDAGIHKVVWNAKGNSSGVYVVLVESDGKQDTRKITFMK